MIRNSQLFKLIPTLTVGRFHLSAQCSNKNVNSQVKILGRLLGEKKSGSKKRWFPSEQGLPPPTKFTSVKKSGKNTSRRINVLNKLFMRHITDLLATGEASEEIIGKGLEISKVKVSPDFHLVNVFWIAKGTAQDDEIQAILSNCSGILRYELSQLRLMGEVPRIQFVKDKIYANLAEVENILRKCDFGEDHKKTDSNQVLHDFVGYPERNIGDGNEIEGDEPLPAMRHDVFGLNHEEIMRKISIKLRKSKHAWELYEQNMTVTDGTESEVKEEEFKKFLKQREYKKITSERKRDFKYYEDFSKEDYFEDDLQQIGKDDRDYFIEEYDKDKV